jgi:hypothetical protein
MIGIALVALLLSAGDFRFGRCDGVCAVRGDSALAVIRFGGSAELLESWWELGTKTLVLDGDKVGLGGIDFSQRGFTARWATLPARDLDLEVGVAGSNRSEGDWDDTAVAAEVGRLLGPSGVRAVRIRRGAPLAIAPSTWDLDGNGKLDLWRDESPDQESAEEHALRTALRDAGVRFPQVILFADSIRLGWPLADSVSVHDTALSLASGGILPWRDAAGRARTYLLEGPRGERRDSFAIEGYSPGRIRIRGRGKNGALRWDHPRGDLVVRPRADFPAFGSTDRKDRKSSPILFIEPGALADPVRCARVLAREIGHLGGLADVADPGNLMSALLRMDVETPVLTPTQALRLRNRLDCLFPDPASGSVDRDSGPDW